MAPWMELMQKSASTVASDTQPLEGVNFEWIVARAKRWIAAHERELHDRK